MNKDLEMSKIAEFKAAKNRAELLRRSVIHCLGRDGPENDKATFDVRFCGLENAAWAPMKFVIEAAYGYYGSPSCYSSSSETMGKYLARSIQAHKGLLLDYAIKLADKDTETARLAAENEAKDVLRNTVEATP